MAGLRDLARAYPEVRFLAISIDAPEASAKLAKGIASDGRGPAGFPFLHDPLGRVILRYGIRDESYRGQKEYGLPYPSVFVLDEKGRVRWSKVERDYTQRPSNEDVAAALDAIE